MKPDSTAPLPSSLLSPLTKRGLIPFLMAGYPDQASSLRMAIALIDEGVVALEIGVPFSDPVADGPVIQMAAAHALDRGATLLSSLELIRAIKRARPKVSVVLFTYLNPIRRLGVSRFTELARAAGVDATLVVDLPPEEAAEHVRIHREAGLGTIFLASPTSSPVRLAKIVSLSTGFVYAISRAGTTGEAKAISESLAQEVSALQQVAGDLPIAIGFGISTPQQAAAVSRLAPAVVIGSRFLSLIHESSDTQEAETKMRAFARDCIREIASEQVGR